MQTLSEKMNVVKVTTEIATRFKQPSSHVVTPKPVKIQGDALQQLKSNIDELTDLHSRLSFMMKEVSYLLRK